MKLTDALYCYWVEEGRLLAGEYPGDLDAQKAERKLRALLDVGVTLFVDLTHADDRMKPYEPILNRISPLTSRLHAPIVDVSIPSNPQQMERILDAIDAEIARGGIAYVHCWGGIGRTGTVAGCWLARHGYAGPRALERLLDLWLPKPGHPTTPQTREQRDYIRSWSEID